MWRLPISLEWNQGLIVLTGGPDGPVDRLAQDGHLPQARARIEALQPRLRGSAVCRIAARMPVTSGTRRTEPFLIDTAFEHGLPLVATNEPYFAQRADFEAHDALIAIAEGTVVNADDRRKLTPGPLFQEQQPRWRCFSRICRRRWRTRSRSPGAAPIRAKKHNPILPRFTGESERSGGGIRCRNRGIEAAGARGACRSAWRSSSRRRASRRTDYDERLEFELVDHRADEVSRLLPDRCRLHQMGKGARHSGRAGPRFGRRFAGRLGADDHRYRSACAFRCCSSASSIPNACRCRISTSTSARTGARRSSATSRSKYGRDQVAQIITFGTLQARAVLRDVGRVLQMPYGQVDRLCQAGAVQSGQSGDAEKGDRGRAEAAGGRARGRGGRAAFRHCHAARGPLPPRLHPCGGHRHRRPAARRAGAALPRSALGHAGHPVQHEMGRGGGPREVRLPRPEDADRAGHGRAIRRAGAASRSTCCPFRSTTRRPTKC